MQNGPIPPPPPFGMPLQQAGLNPWAAPGQQPGPPRPGMPAAGPTGVLHGQQSAHQAIVLPTYAMWKLRKQLDPSLPAGTRQSWDNFASSRMPAAEKELEQLSNKRREATRKTPQEQLAKLNGKTARGAMQVENFVHQLNTHNQEQGSDDEWVLVYCDWQERTVRKKLEIPEITIILKRLRAVPSPKHITTTPAPGHTPLGYPLPYQYPGQMNAAAFQQAALYPGLQPTAVPPPIQHQGPNIAAKAHQGPQQPAPPRPMAAGVVIPPPPTGMPPPKAPKGVVVVQGKGDNGSRPDIKKNAKYDDADRENDKQIKVEHVTTSTHTIKLPKDEPISDRLQKTLERSHEESTKSGPSRAPKTYGERDAIIIPNRSGKRGSAYYARGRRLAHRDRLSEETLWEDDGASYRSAGAMTNGSSPPGSPRSPYVEPARPVVYGERPSKHRHSKPQVHLHPRVERTFLRPPSPPSPLMDSFAAMDLSDAYYPEEAFHLRHPHVAAPEPPPFNRRYGASARHISYLPSLGHAAPPLRARGMGTVPLEPLPVLGDYFENDREHFDHDVDYLPRDSGYERARDARDYIAEGRQRVLQREREQEEQRRADEAFANRRRVRELQDELQARRGQMYRSASSLPYPTGY